MLATNPGPVYIPDTELQLEAEQVSETMRMPEGGRSSEGMRLSDGDHISDPVRLLEPNPVTEQCLEPSQVSEAVVLPESGLMPGTMPLHKTYQVFETTLQQGTWYPGLTVTRQAELLNVSRTGAYQAQYEEKPVDFKTISLMHRIDALYTAYPYYGSRRMVAALFKEGIVVNRKRVRRVMREMGIEAVYPGPNLSKRLQATYCRPYLLRHLDITRINQVWGIDFTYIRMGKGFMFLFVIIDWFSRKIVDYEISSTIEKEVAFHCLKRAFTKDKPEIINSDQGSQFTNADYLTLIAANDIKVSMDGKGRAKDNARTERFFRSLKYERIFLNEYDTPQQLRRSINEYVNYYNTVRPHQSNDYMTPEEIYIAGCAGLVA